MYKIGICDDGKNICSSLENMILEYAKKRNVKLDINVWYSGEQLCTCLLEKQPLDILFLDIELLEMSGIQAGDFIRNSLENRKMQIIYISGKSSYAQELFKTQPMDFLVKPISQEDIDRVLDLAAKYLETSPKKFEFRSRHELYSIPFDEILYFASEGRKIKIFTLHGTQEFYGKLRDISCQLPGSFLSIHHSYAINQKHVFHYTYDTVELIDGTILTISKAYRKQMREKMLDNI